VNSPNFVLVKSHKHWFRLFTLLAGIVLVNISFFQTIHQITHHDLLGYFSGSSCTHHHAEVRPGTPGFRVETEGDCDLCQLEAIPFEVVITLEEVLTYRACCSMVPEMDSGFTSNCSPAILRLRGPPGIYIS
jgi:hypothetical protein